MEAPNVSAISAPQLIGCLLNYTLYGVLFVQIYIYRLSFPNDNNYIKILVYFVFALETAQTCMNGADIYNWFSAGFGDFSEFVKPGLSPIYTPIMGSITSLIVQLFFCYRIWIIKKSIWWWCCFIGMISVAQAVAGFIDGALGLLQHDVAERFNETATVYLWLVGDATADILIAVTMTFILTKLHAEHHRQTNDAVAKIVRLTIETNTVSACIALLALILFAVAKNTVYFITPTIVLGKIYANTLLVSFNNRAFIHKSQHSYVVHSHSGLSTTQAVSSTFKSRVPFSTGFELSSIGSGDVDLKAFHATSGALTTLDFQNGTHGEV